MWLFIRNIKNITIKYLLHSYFQAYHVVFRLCHPDCAQAVYVLLAFSSEIL